MNFEGKKPYYIHIVGEISGISKEDLSLEAINSTFRQILGNLDINIIKNEFHEFEGGGLSIVYILSASHLAIHTWPEMDYLHFDLITCSPKTDYENLKTELFDAYPNVEIKTAILDY